MKKDKKPSPISFEEVWADKKPVEFEDTVEKRLNFVESVCKNEKGEFVTNARIHIEMQEKAFEWEQDGSNGLIRVPYGVGKSTQVTQALNLYKLTVNPNHLIIILSSKPENALSRVDWIRDMIENSTDYRRWCKDNGLRPLELSDKDTGSTRKIYVKRTSTSPHPSVFGSGISEGGTGWRATILCPDDIVDRKNSRFEKDRDKVYSDWSNTWKKRVIPSGMVLGVFTPYHPKDANMRILETGRFGELKMRVSKTKENYELFHFKPDPDEVGKSKLVERDMDVPLWTEVGYTTKFYEDAEADDSVAYMRGYEMREDVEETGSRCYAHFSDEYYDGKEGGNVTSAFDYEKGGASVYLIVDFNYDPQCWSLSQRQGNKSIIFDEIRKRESTTQQMAIETAKHLLRRGITFVNIIGEAMSKNRRMNYDDYSEIKDVFSQYGISYSIKTGRSNPSVLNSITLLNNGFIDSRGRKHILVHERCKYLIRDLRKVERGKDGKPVDKDSELTHFSDGLRYYYWYIKKGRKTRGLPPLR